MIDKTEGRVGKVTKENGKCRRADILDRGTPPDFCASRGNKGVADEAFVCRGKNDFGMHGGNKDRRVAPSTVEEYRFLLTNGCAMGEKDMPPLELPQ